MIDVLALGITVTGVQFQHSESLTVSEALRQTIKVSAGATGLSIPLTGLDAPKVLVVYGAKGVSAKVGGEPTGSAAYPLFMASALNGMTGITLAVANADTVEHEVTIVAAE